MFTRHGQTDGQTDAQGDSVCTLHPPLFAGV